MAHDKEAYAKAREIIEKCWPKYGTRDGRSSMCNRQAWDDYKNGKR